MKKRTIRKGQTFVDFVKEGGKSSRTTSTNGVLSTANDWNLIADVHQRSKSPQDITSTALRPDTVLYSKATKQVIMVGLTVPWEERMEEAYERKRAKYQYLVGECQQRGWRPWCLPVEVGCRGFAGQSLW